MLSSSSNDQQASPNDQQASNYWQYSSLLAAVVTNNEPSRSLWPSGSGFGFSGESELLPSIVGGNRDLVDHDDDDDDDNDDDDMNMYISLEEPQQSVITLRPSSLINQDITSKKSHHNVKEKLRRMKLNDAYSSLKSLLPDAYKSKKWSSPVVVTKVLEYIPELQEEVETLRERKDQMLLSIQKKQILSEDRPTVLDFSSSSSSSVPTVSISEINEGEIMAQICVQGDPPAADIFPSLLANIEREAIQIASASTLLISPERVCFNLHLIIKGSFQPNHHVDILRDKIVSWLCELLPYGTS